MAHRSWFQMTRRGLDRFDNFKRLMGHGIEPIIQKGIKGITKAALDALSKALSQEPPPEQLGGRFGSVPKTSDGHLLDAKARADGGGRR